MMIISGNCDAKCEKINSHGTLVLTGTSSCTGFADGGLLFLFSGHIIKSAPCVYDIILQFDLNLNLFYKHFCKNSDKI